MGVHPMVGISGMKQKIRLTKLQKEYVELARACDGCEVPMYHWKVAEQLVKKGIATLGPPRGPDRSFRRLLLTRAYLMDTFYD